MALHERFDPAGRRILLTDKERREHDAGEALLLVGLAAALCAPGFVVERYVCPFLDGLPWFVVGLLLSGLILFGACKTLGVPAGLLAYLLLSLGSAYHLFTTKPATPRTPEARRDRPSDTTPVTPSHPEQQASNRIGVSQISELSSPPEATGRTTGGGPFVGERFAALVVGPTYRYAMLSSEPGGWCKEWTERVAPDGRVDTVVTRTGRLLKPGTAEWDASPRKRDVEPWWQRVSGGYVEVGVPAGGDERRWLRRVKIGATVGDTWDEGPCRFRVVAFGTRGGRESVTISESDSVETVRVYVRGVGLVERTDTYRFPARPGFTTTTTLTNVEEVVAFQGVPAGPQK